MFAEHEREALIKSTRDEQKALTAIDPDTFFVPPYVGPSGWFGGRLARSTATSCASSLTEAWRLTAPKRLVQAFNEAEAVSRAARPLPLVRTSRKDGVPLRRAGRHRLPVEFRTP